MTLLYGLQGHTHTHTHTHTLLFLNYTPSPASSCIFSSSNLTTIKEVWLHGACLPGF